MATRSNNMRIAGAPRWLALALLASGFAAFAPGQAQDRPQDRQPARVTVDIGDVVVRGGQPYYRHGGYRDADRLVVARDRHGRPVYYRLVYRDPYGQHRFRYRHHDRNRYVYDDPRRVETARRVDCNSRGNCTVTWQDPDYGGGGYGPRHGAPPRWRDGEDRRDDDR
jgi:hypothetical protein